MKRSIWVVTTSRADYGLLFNLMKELKEDNNCDLKIIATGMHVSEKHGNTYKKIVDDGFEIYKKIDMELTDDSSESIVRSIGKGCIKFADIFSEIKPDVLVVLGDRFDLLPAVITCLVNNVIVAHIHGGETSEGAIDESIRHSVSKMSHIHFPAAEEYRERLIQLGEDPENIFNYGAPGLDNIYKLKFLSKEEFFKKTGLDKNKVTAIVTFHPVTLDDITAKEQAENSINAIKESGINAIFTSSNADKGGSIFNEIFKSFCDRYPDRFKFIQNLGSELYFSALKNVDMMIGNSSSGLTEAPSFNLPVVNIGSRQDGRIKAGNIINSTYEKADIKSSIEKAKSADFKNKIKDVENPYDKMKNGKASHMIKEKLMSIMLDKSMMKKKFHNLNTLTLG